MWISLGNHAQVALIFAQTDPELRHRGLACFLVDTDQPGFQAQEIHHKMGLHASDTASIALDDVFVADDALLGDVGDGFKVAMSALDGGRLSVAAGCVGICQGCVDESVSYAREREQFGRPIAGFQLVQAMLAEMRVRTDAARLLVWRAAGCATRAGPARPRPRSRSSTRPRPRCGARTRRSRCTAAPATSTTTPSSAGFATRASRRSTRARRRSSSSSSAAR